MVIAETQTYPAPLSQGKKGKVSGLCCVVNGRKSLWLKDTKIKPQETVFPPEGCVSPSSPQSRPELG